MKKFIVLTLALASLSALAQQHKPTAQDMVGTFRSSATYDSCEYRGILLDNGDLQVEVEDFRANTVSALIVKSENISKVLEAKFANSPFLFQESERLSNKKMEYKIVRISYDYSKKQPTSIYLENSIGKASSLFDKLRLGVPLNEEMFTVVETKQGELCGNLEKIN